MIYSLLAAGALVALLSWDSKRYLSPMFRLGFISVLVIAGLAALHLHSTELSLLGIPVLIGFAGIGAMVPFGKRRVPTGPIAYRYCPNCISKLVRRAYDGVERDACPNCDFVHWNNPIVVGAAIIPWGEAGDNIILVKRKFNPQAGKWALPAGFGDPGETPPETVVRESMEEVRLAIEIDRLYAVEGGGSNNSQAVIFYVAKPTTQTPTAGSDALEAKPFGFDELPELAFPSHRKIVAAWIEEQRARRSST